MKMNKGLWCFFLLFAFLLIGSIVCDAQTNTAVPTVGISTNGVTTASPALIDGVASSLGIPTAVLDLIPLKYILWIAALVWALPYLGRAWHAYKTDGGFKGIWSSIVFGTNTPSTTTTTPPLSSAGKVISVIAIFAIGFMVGCKSTPQTIAYQTIGSLEGGVTAAYSGYVQAVIAGAASTNSFPTISKEFNDFQADAYAATVIAANGTNALSTTALTQESAAILSAIATSSTNK